MKHGMTDSSLQTRCLLLLTMTHVQVSAEMFDWVHVGVLAATLTFFGFLVFYQDPFFQIPQFGWSCSSGRVLFFFFLIFFCPK